MNGMDWNKGGIFNAVSLAASALRQLGGWRSQVEQSSTYSPLISSLPMQTAPDSRQTDSQASELSGALVDVGGSGVYVHSRPAAANAAAEALHLPPCLPLPLSLARLRVCVWVRMTKPVSDAVAFELAGRKAGAEI